MAEAVTRFPIETTPRSEEDLIWSIIESLRGNNPDKEVLLLSRSTQPRGKQDLLYTWLQEL